LKTESTTINERIATQENGIMQGLQTRQFAALLLMLLCSALFAACGATAPQAPAAEAPTTVPAEAPTAASAAQPTAAPVAEATAAPTSGSAEPVTITFWQKAGGDFKGMEQLVAQFNAEQSDVQIELVGQGSDEYDRSLPLAFQSQQNPDVFLTSLYGVQFYEAGYLLPVDDLVDPALLTELRKYMTSGVNTFDGKTYVVPATVVTNRLIYNKELFSQAGLDPEKPPTTYSEVMAAAKTITEYGQGDIFGFGMPLKWAGFVDWQIDALATAPTEGLSTKGLFDKATQQFNIPQYEPVVALYREMMLNGYVFPGASSLDNDPMRAAFAEGKIGMYVGQSWDVATLNNQFNAQVDWAAAPLPVPDGAELLRINSSPGKPYAIAANTEHPEEAAMVLEWLISPETVGALQKMGMANALLPAAQTAEFQPEGSKQFPMFLADDLDVAPPLSPAQFIKVQGKSLKDVLLELIQTDQPIAPALEELNAQYNQLYQDGISDGSIKADLFIE
jgi:multiple sugar transport system substrate-binding protein